MPLKDGSQLRAQQQHEKDHYRWAEQLRQAMANATYANNDGERRREKYADSQAGGDAVERRPRAASPTVTVRMVLHHRPVGPSIIARRCPSNACARQANPVVINPYWVSVINALAGS